MPGLIAIPCLETMWTPCVVALHRMILNSPTGCREFFLDDPFPLHIKREKIGNALLADSGRDLDWVLMVDSDMLPPEDAVGRLETSLADFDVVGALCYTRRPPHDVCAGVRGENGEDEYLRVESTQSGIVPVEWVGTGCVMIHRRVFVSIAKPWFVPEESGRGEDVSFMRQASKAGFRIGCDVGLTVGHLSLINVDRGYASWWSEGYPERDRERRATELFAKVRRCDRSTGGSTSV